MTRPKPTDGTDYRSYALIENALATGFHQAGLFVSLSRRMDLGEMVWDQLTTGERTPVRDETRARLAAQSDTEAS